MDFVTLHLIALIATVPCIAYADHMGFQYFTGRVQTVSVRKAAWAHRLVTLGLLVLIGTGIVITIPAWEIFLANRYFYVKMAFVAALVINGAVIGRVMHKAVHTPFAQLPSGDKRLLIVSGAVSGVSWVATVCLAFFFI